MKFETWYAGENYTDKGWGLKINDQVVNDKLWKKEKLIKVISAIIEVLEIDS